jgi:hypothetical protein
MSGVSLESLAKKIQNRPVCRGYNVTHDELWKELLEWYEWIDEVEGLLRQLRQQLEKKKDGRWNVVSIDEVLHGVEEK